jgi:hypothetical protein
MWVRGLVTVATLSLLGVVMAGCAGDPAPSPPSGIDGLTVADAAVIPTITTGNTTGPAAVVGEKAAEYLLA